MTNVLYVNQVILMLDSFFYAAKPRLLREPRPMQTLHSSHPSLGAASRLSLLSLGRCTQQVSLHTCLSLAPSAKFSTCKLCSRPGMLASGRRKRLPSAQPSLPPLSLLSLGRFAPSAQEICAKNQPSSQATLSLIFYLISNMQTLHSSQPSVGAVSRLSLLSLGCCTCDGPKVQSPFAPSAQETFTRIGLTLRVKTFTRLVSTKRKGRKSYRRSSDLPSPRWGTSHLRDIRHGRASLVTLKRKDRMSYRRSRNLHTTCCILQHLQQSCCRTLRLVPLKRKGRMSYRRSRNLRTFHRHLVVAQALLCRCGVSHLISYALKRKGRKSYRRSCGACLTKSAHPPFSLVGSVQSRSAVAPRDLGLFKYCILGMVSFLAFVGASVLPSGSAAAVRSVVAGRLASLDSSSVVVVSGGASGVDSIAVDVAKSMGFETLVFAPKTNDWPGFKARNIQIAQKAGSIIVITLPLYKGGRKGECYHCNRVGKNNQHQVSGGCWTGKLHRNYEVVVLPSPLSCKQFSHVGLRSASTDFGLFNHSTLGMNKNEIFVFGSNLAGIHGAGAALYAKLHHGAPYIKNVTAEWGVKGKNGVGLQGSAYAIPTKDEWIKTLPIERIEPFVKEFIEFAKANNEMNFNVVRVGCGLAGYKEIQIAPLFEGSPSNVKFNWENYDSGCNDPWIVEADGDNINDE